MLDACAAVLKDVDGAWFTSHVNENPAEVAEVERLFADAEHYVDTYDKHGLLGERAVLAHNVHATDAELGVLAARGTAVAHCPTSNSALGSGLFPLRRHLEHGVRVALGSDVGAGTGFSLLAEGLQAYLVQSLLGEAGDPLTATHLLHLATRAGALALGLGDAVGDLSVGRDFDAVRVRPLLGSRLHLGLRHAATHEEVLARIFTLGGDADLAGVWVGGAPHRLRALPRARQGRRPSRCLRVSTRRAEARTRSRKASECCARSRTASYMAGRVPGSTVSTRSPPARRNVTARAPGRQGETCAALPRSSETTTRRKPRSPRSMPVTISWEKAAGVPRSIRR